MEMAGTLRTIYQPNLRKDNHRNSTWTTWPGVAEALTTDGSLGWSKTMLDGQLTLGQLIAFRIISGYVTQPLLRLSTIWQRIQELRVSFERLADIVDTPEESTDLDKAKIPTTNRREG